MIGVAQGEGFGQGKLEGQLMPTVITHRGRRFVGWPGAHAAAVPGSLLIHPRVRRAAHPLGIATFAVQMVRQHQSIFPLLLPDVTVVGQRNGYAIAKAAYAGQRAEVMVEGTVFLHQDHHVFDIVDGAGAVIGWDRQGFADRRG